MIAERRWLSYALVWAVALLASVAHTLVADAPPDGDEPHYLLIANSLVDDGDLDLADDYADRALVLSVYPQARFSPLEASTHAGRYDGDEALRPVHGIGVALVAVPPVAAGFGTTGVRLWVALLSSLIWPLLLAVVDRLFARRRGSHVVAVLAVALTLPWLPYSSQLFPEPIGALFVVAALFVVVCRPPTLRWLAAGAACAAALPWIHVRFSILAAGLLVALVVRGAAPVRSFGDIARRPKALVAVAVPAVLSAGALLAYNAHLYGAPSPNAAYKVEPFINSLELTPESAYRWGTADMLSPVFGVLPYGPLLLVALAGVALVVRRMRWTALGALAVVAGYYVVTTGLGKDGGWCPPGRFACVVVPLLALPLAAALGVGRRAWAAFVPLAVLSASIAVAATARFPHLYTSQVDRPRLAVVRTLAPVWPSFPSRLPDRVDVDVDAMRTDIGAGRVLLAHVQLRPGGYVGHVEVTTTGPPGELVGAVTVETDAGGVVTRADLTAGTSRADLAVAVRHDAVQLVLHLTGAGRVELHQASLGPAPGEAVDARSLRDTVPEVALWAGIVALLALALLPSRRSVDEQ